MDGSDHYTVPSSTSNTTHKGKRKSLSTECQSPAGKQRRSSVLYSKSENPKLTEVKKIMERIKGSLKEEGRNDLHDFLKDKINDLEMEKRELVGVFGKTGAGKSSLINAIIEEKNLLPSGRISACTSVMIKLEANMHNLKYEAEIEFIPKEEWEEELRFVLTENTDEDDDDDDDNSETDEKMSALYGEKWRNMSFENLMEKKHFREITEFLSSKKKILKFKTAKELSAELKKYTRMDLEDKEGKEAKLYSPLVKCVTIRVPSYDLQHVTLLDLPGNGDRNKSRNRMWREVVGSCSTVWIVAEMNRAAAEEESWEILESASSLMGNGGECQQIHFICTKSDINQDLSDKSAVEGLRTGNDEAKRIVKKVFDKKKKIKKHFGEKCLEVFTVSSKAFLQGKLEPDDTEIPRLQEFLKKLNDSHSETLNYVSGARGILSLIQGAKSRDVAGKIKEVSRHLENKLDKELEKVQTSMDEACEAFEKCLSEGLKNSEDSLKKLMDFLNPVRKSARGFYRTLKCVVKNGGVYKPKKGKQIDLNMLLASCLTDSIDDEFRKTFPNDRKDEPFNGVINEFSLGTDELIGKYKDVELLLVFLKTEEEKIKTQLNKMILDRKKKIYNSLTETIEDNMQECYEKAAGFTGPDTLKNMRDTIEKHVHDSKDMFQQAKEVMFKKLKDLTEKIMMELKETLRQSIKLSVATDDDSIPDVSADLEKVKSCYDQLKGSPHQEISMETRDKTFLPGVSDVKLEQNGQNTKVREQHQENTSSIAEVLPTNTEEAAVAIQDQMNTDVWRSEADLTGLGPSDRNPQRSQSLTRPEEMLSSVRSEFVRRVTEPVLKRLLDELFQDNIINGEEKDSVKTKTRADGARDVIDMVISKGTKASSSLISHLRVLDNYLFQTLRLG